MRHSMLITKHLLASVIGLSMMGLASAASVTYPASSSIFSGGASTFEYSFSSLTLLDYYKQTIGGAGQGEVTTVLDEDGYYAGASFAAPTASVTLDHDTHQILGVETNGGVTHTARRFTIQRGGSITITNLNFDLVNKKIYADLVGSNGLGALSHVHMWNITGINTAITRIDGSSDVPNLDITQTLTGVVLSNDGYLSFSKALWPYDNGLMLKDLMSLSTCGSCYSSGFFSTITLVNRFNVSPDYFAASVPEPSSWALAAMGLLSVGWAVRRGGRANTVTGA